MGNRLRLEDGDELVDLCTVVLLYALRDPDDVTNLLLLQFHVGVEHAVVELLLERVPVQLDLIVEEDVLQGALSHGALRFLNQLTVLREPIDGCAHLLSIFSSSEASESIRVQPAECWVQLGAVVLAELRAERVHGDVDGATIGLKLQDLRHHLRGLTAQPLAELVEVLQVRLVKGVADQFNVHLVQIFFAQAVLHVRSERGIHKHAIVQIADILGSCKSCHGLENTERMTLVHELRNVSLMQSASDKKYDIIDHILVSNVVQKSGQGLGSLCPQVIELSHQLQSALLGNCSSVKRRWLVLQEITVISTLCEIHLHILEGLALC